MARTARSIDESEKRLMDRMRQQGHSWQEIARFFNRDYKRCEVAVKDYRSPYRDSKPIRCRECGALSIVVAKSDPKTCIACDMRAKRLVSKNARPTPAVVSGARCGDET
jgi:hypothetical protein